MPLQPGLLWEVEVHLPLSHYLWPPQLVGHHRCLGGDLLDLDCVVADTIVGVTGVNQLMVMAGGSSGCVPKLLLVALSTLLCVSRPVWHDGLAPTDGLWLFP